MENVSDIRVYLPSNFTFAYASSGYGDATTSDKIYSVWTDITNDYSYISVTKLREDDPIAPGWERIEIGRLPSLIQQMPSFTIRPGLHHIRLFQIRAPFVAGLYHFKIYVDNRTIGEGNFPVAIVKSSLQPAYVTGLVLLKDLLPPTNASGRITAVGTTGNGGYAEAIAYFGPRDLEKVDARGSCYRYWMFGLPAGTFELTASASGFTKDSSRITVETGQSLRVDFELTAGSVIRLIVWSKDGIATIPWGNLWQPPYGTNDPFLPINDLGPHRDIFVRLFNQYDEPLAYWASDDTHFPFGPPWTSATVDRKRNYSPWLLKPSTTPSSTSYSVTLTDARGLASVRLDGHVPADMADLVEGIDAGTYRIEIQVTGYVMREADDWQRTFTIRSGYTLQTDLIRSSWVNATLLIPESRFVPVSNCTVVLVAKSTDDFEKGLAAAVFPNGTSRFNMVLEGFNGLYNRFRNTTDYQDYGFEPVDYSLEVYMTDMGAPWRRTNGTGWYLAQEELVEFHATFGVTSVTATFHLEASSVEFVLRSTQIQQPPQVRPWTFPGAGIRLYMLDELGSLAAIVDPLYYGLIQDAGTTNATLGWPVYGVNYGLPGVDATHGYGVSPHDADNLNAPGRHGLLRVRFTGIDSGPIAALAGAYPTRLEEGKYFVSASTLGYIQRWDSSLYIFRGVREDIQIDLIQGAQIRVELEFRHENMPTAFNGFARVEVYNQDGTLVGASIYGQAQPNYYTLLGVTQGGGYLNYSRVNDFMRVLGPAEGADFGLPNATRLEAQNTFPSSTGDIGDPFYPANTGFINGQRAFLSSMLYSSRVLGRPIPSGNGTLGATNTWASWPVMTPNDANRLLMPQGSVAAFDIYGFHSYSGGEDSRADGLWTNGWDTTNGLAHLDSGLRGSRDVLDIEGWGTYTVRVWAFDPYGPDNIFDSLGPDGIFGTDDDYTSPDQAEGSLSDFRAYAQVTEVTNLEAPWGGSAVAHVVLEEQPSLLGSVHWIDMYGDLRTLAWAQVIERSGDGVWASSATGSYRLWLSEGTHEFFVTTIGKEELWEPYEFEITLSKPGVHTFHDVTLITSSTVTPEFADTFWATVIPLISLLILLSRKRSKNSNNAR